MAKSKKIGVGRLSLAAALIALWACFMALGAESSVVEKVTVSFKSSYGEPEEILEPQITVSGSGCQLDSVSYQTDRENWKPGKKVRVELTVKAANGKYFPKSLDDSQCRVSGADFVSAKAEDDVLVIKADYRPVGVLGSPGEAGWSEDNKGRAVWSEVENAPGYSLTLYGDDKVVKRLEATSNRLDLSDYMTDNDKAYYYEVKAAPLESDDKKYMKAGASVTSEESEFYWVDTGTSEVSGSGSTGKKTGWRKNGDVWKYYDGNGSLTKGWQLVDNVWYYLGDDGLMRTGWLYLPEGRWYYLNSSGAMETGWVQPTPNAWYYCNQDGLMLTGWVFVDGSWYYFNQDGLMLTGWVLLNNTWYYLNQDGRMAANTIVDGWRLGPDGAGSQ